MAESGQYLIDGTVSPGYERVRDAFVENFTRRGELGHQAGLFAFDEPVDRTVVADLDRQAEIMARQRPAWEPGEPQRIYARDMEARSGLGVGSARAIAWAYSVFADGGRELGLRAETIVEP